VAPIGAEPESLQAAATATRQSSRSRSGRARNQLRNGPPKFVWNDRIDEVRFTFKSM
jgi:hypothetical protein